MNEWEVIFDVLKLLNYEIRFILPKDPKTSVFTKLHEASLD